MWLSFGFMVLNSVVKQDSCCITNYFSIPVFSNAAHFGDCSTWWDNTVSPAYLFTCGSFSHQLRRQVIFYISGSGVRSSPHQQPHCFHLTFVVLQRADNVQGSVSIEHLKQAELLITVCRLHWTSLNQNGLPEHWQPTGTMDGQGKCSAAPRLPPQKPREDTSVHFLDPEEMKHETQVRPLQMMHTCLFILGQYFQYLPLSQRRRPWAAES